MKQILAFVGPSGAGKTTLILEALRQRPEKVGNLLSVTTRQSRGTPEDARTYEFMSRDEFQRLVDEGAFIHWVEHVGNYYGTLRRHADDVLRDKYAVGAFVEQGVLNLRRSGYTVRVIKIQPVGYRESVDVKRREEDILRAQIDVSPDVVIENSFSEGGRERAISAVLAYIDALQ